MKPISILRTICCLLLAAGLSPAADEQGKVSVQFVRVPSTADDRTAQLKLEDGKILEVELPSSALSDPYQVTKPKNWILGKTRSVGDEVPEFVEMGRAPSTESQRQVIVVIDKGDMNDGKLELIPMDLSVKPDAFAFVNASKHDISGELGIERFGIAPMEHAQLTAEASKVDHHDRRFCEVSFRFLKDKDYVKYFDGRWKLEDGMSAIIIFHHEAVGAKLKFTVIREYVHSE